MPIRKLRANFTEADIDDEIILMRLDNGELLSLADTAAATWRLIDGIRDRAALLTALADEFDADEASIASDVDDFLEQLRDAGLLDHG